MNNKDNPIIQDILSFESYMLGTQNKVRPILYYPSLQILFKMSRVIRRKTTVMESKTSFSNAELRPVPNSLLNI